MTSDPPPGPGGPAALEEEEEAYEDVDAETSFRIGLLAELSAIRESLQGIEAALADADAKRDHDADADGSPAYQCRSCGDRILGTPSARRHAVREHGAPTDGDAWAWSMTRLDEEDTTDGT